MTRQFEIPEFSFFYLVFLFVLKVQFRFLSLFTLRRVCSDRPDMWKSIFFESGPVQFIGTQSELLHTCRADAVQLGKRVDCPFKL